MASGVGLGPLLLATALSGAVAPVAAQDREMVGEAAPPVRVERLSFVMGTELRLVVDAPARDVGLAAAERALREVERLDVLLTTWNPASPMSALNRAPVGEPVRPAAELVGLLAEAFAWTARTGHAFDPTLGPLIDAWGLRHGGARPDDVVLERARAASRDAFALAQSGGTVTRLHPDAWIDTGAFGKGAALRAAGDTLRAHAVRSALLDLGGQLLAVGRDGSTGLPWKVAVAHPSRRREPVGGLALADVSVSTSGNSERSVEVDGEPIGHLLDPRSGRPAPLWGSVTVVAADPLAADALSTALYVMGPDAGLAWASALGDVGALFLIEREGALVSCWNAAMERWLAEGFGLPVAPGGAEPGHPRHARGRSCS